MPSRQKKIFFSQKLLLEPAAAGRSNLQRDYRSSLLTLGVLVLLVLLIACANVANLMTAQAAARAREMALRVSIGAGRWRLVQLVLVESALLAFIAAAIGAIFAWRSAPVIVNMINPADNPARLILPADWRVLLFGLALAFGVTILFGLAPALRASSVKPSSALKGGENPHSRRRLMYALVAVQVAFCFVVHFVAGLFVTTFDRLSSLPNGFSAERIVNLESVTYRPQPAPFWDQVADHLRTVPGVESVALTIWPLMSGESTVDYISINGAPPTDAFSDFLDVSPGWIDAMKIRWIDGRDFRAGETSPGVAIVNEAFAKQYFNGENPVGKSFERLGSKGARIHFQVVGYVRDARSRDRMRRPILPTVYVPFLPRDSAGNFGLRGRGTFVVRTSGSNPLALASILRKEVTRARPEFRVTNVRTQVEINRATTLRERLLAMLALFFAIVALLLSGVGLIRCARLFRCATAARNRYSHGAGRSGVPRRAACHRRCVRDGAGGRCRRSRSGDGIGSVYRVIALPGEGHRYRNARASFADHLDRSVVGIASGGHPRRPNRSGCYVACRVGKHECHCGPASRMCSEETG